jgi:hypothetical protein
MSDKWQPNVKIKDLVDVNDPSFPWRNGKPDWDYYRLIKAAEREEKYKNRKHKPFKEYCCAVDDGPRLAKSLGKVEIDVKGEKKLAPLCQKHKNLFVNEDQ